MILELVPLELVRLCPAGYGHMLTDFFLPAIEEYDLENMWFQHMWINDEIIKHFLSQHFLKFEIW